jgi:hypothetical protein
LEKSCKNVENVKSKKLSNSRKSEVTQAVVKRTENNTWRRYGNVLSMEGNTRPQRLLTWSPEIRKAADDWKRSGKGKWIE